MYLGWPEYLVVLGSLALSIWLGVKSNNTNKNESFDGLIKNEVPLGSIIMSLIAAETSGVSMLGKPAEAYMYGMEFLYIQIVAALGCLMISISVFVPILIELQTPSLYEYFALRFDTRISRLVTATFIILRVLYTAVAVIPPAIVIAQFSGVNADFIIIALCSVTIFYTTLGGLKGVIRTDVLQGIIMFVSMGILTATSVGQVGGINRIFALAYETGRTELPNFSTADLSERSSIWVYFCFLYSLSPVILNHSNYQRIKIIDARKMNISIFLLIGGIILMSLISTFTGLAIYSFYYGCDPKLNKLIPNYSNLVVYWLNDVGKNFFGLRGVYIAGITCASISSMSTHMNSSADLMCKEITRKWKNLDNTFCLRSLTLIVGALGSFLAFYFKRSGSLIELSYTLIGIEGIASSLFIMGALVVPANATGALAGGLSSLVFTLIVSLGSRIFLGGHKLQYSTKYMSMESCPNASIIAPINETAHEDSSKVFFLFTISPFCVGVLAVLISLTVGLAVSVIFPDKTHTANSRNPNLYARFFRNYIDRSNRRITDLIVQEEMNDLRIENE